MWTYGRWIFSGRVELRPFRYLQEGLLLGDVFLVVEGLVALGLPGAWTAAALGQIGMAALWGGVRIVFLARNRPLLFLQVPEEEARRDDAPERESRP